MISLTFNEVKVRRCEDCEKPALTVNAGLTASAIKYPDSFHVEIDDAGDRWLCKKCVEDLIRRLVLLNFEWAIKAMTESAEKQAKARNNGTRLKR